MPLQTTHPVTVSSGNYRDELFAFLNIAEQFRNLPYIDKLPTPAIATIGYGFNIETVSAYMALVLNQLGILGDKTEPVTQQILGQFIVAATQTNVEADLRAGLNALAQQYGVPEFMIDELQGKTIFDQILSGATIAVTGGSPLVIQGKEQRLDGNLAFSLAHDTKEYVALMSLFYNGESLVMAGGKLATAVIHGDRAEAWYQIRYNSNVFKNDPDPTQGANGIASRRISESNLFSLYNTLGPGVPEAEAKDVLRMYTTHRPEIQSYESTFSTKFAQGGTATIQFQLIGAKTTLIPLYAQGHPIDGDVLVGIDNLFAPEHLSGREKADLIFGELGLDRLRGNEGADVLYGGFGDDELTGGTGDDYLDGGQGNDTYVFLTGDGHDTIRDADGLGTLRYDGQLLVGGIRIAGDPADTFVSGGFTYQLADQPGGRALVITRSGQPGDSLTLPNFLDGQLGIHLQDLTTLPSGTPPVIDYNNGQPTVRYDGDETDNAPTLTAAANHEAYGYGGNDSLDLSASSAAFNHQLFGGTGHDALYSGGGLDRLFGESGVDILNGGGGRDVLDGGDGDDLLVGDVAGQVDGDDYLTGGPGNDGLEGTGGNDILIGGADNDELTGDDDINFATRPVGNDYLDGGPGADTLWGGLGNDFLTGGSEDDRLYGDNAVITEQRVWTPLSGTVVTNPANIVFFTAAGGEDFLDGGPGNDLLQGDGGADVLLGGDGADTLYGDNASIGTVQEGQDLLDGGAGNDTLYGGGGADTLLGGADDDTLVGDFIDDPVGANDLLDGGAGKDTLVGARGDDILFGGTENDLLFGNEGHDVLDGGSGEDELQGGPGTDLLRGGTDNDRLFGDDENDQLFGDAGADYLEGNAGNDLLDGGTGTDTLVGGVGDDTYVFNKGDGTDTIDDSAGDANRVVFGTGITADGLALGQGSLRIIVAETGDELHILNFDPTDPLAVNPISAFEFQDGTVLTSSDLVAQGFDLIGTPGIDFLSGGEVYARIFGIGGDDTLTGGSGDNLLDGGAGNDQLFGAGGLDTLEGREGDDQLFGQDGADDSPLGKSTPTMYRSRALVCG